MKRKGKLTKMKELFDAYSIESIIIIFVGVLIALKNGIEFLEWGFDRSKNRVHFFDKYKTFEEELKKQKEHDDKVDKLLEKLVTQIQQLTNSDKDAIKSYITEKHHFFVYKQGWIDDYSLDCLERRFEHYREEGGNSFIEQEMNELRSLPKRQYKKQSEKET